MESLFLYHAAPILKEVRPAVLVSIWPECVAVWKNRERAMCRATGLRIAEVQRSGNLALYLIYSADAMAAALAEREAVGILAGYGYGADENIEARISHLRARFSGKNFPHEIGLFLGYPTGDVRAFIENNGKNCACCRYWKAYSNIEQAKKTWRRIDRAHACAIEILGDMPPIHIAANLMKAV